MRNKPMKRNIRAADPRRPMAMQAWEPFLPFFEFAPFDAVRKMNEEMARLWPDFDRFNMLQPFNADFWAPENLPFNEEAWLPAVEIKEKDGMLTIHAELPGMKKDEIQIEFTDNALVLSGERKKEDREEKEGFFRSEFNYGSFYRRIPLPEGFDADKATAEFNNGVLDIHIAVPKFEKKARKLEIAEKTPKTHAKAAG